MSSGHQDEFNRYAVIPLRALNLLLQKCWPEELLLARPCARAVRDIYRQSAAFGAAPAIHEHCNCAGGAVVHSYTGDLDDALSLLAVHPRLHIGINGCSLRTDASLDAMAALPLERLLAETDAPWCDMRPTHASAAHVTSRPEAVDRKRHRSDCLVKGRNEPCNMAQVQISC